jgi:outer membrane receptor protein involved in Fe transport
MRNLRSRTIAERALVLFALTGLLAVSANAQTTAPKKDSKDSKDGAEVQKLEKFEVTGSRIKRIDTDTVSPVVSFTTEQLKVQGFNTLGDALQAMPQNSGQVLTPTDSGTSFTPGVSTINLRGLGNNNTLVLVNGRRAAPYASPGFSGFQTMFDFNSIPSGAIERVDILKDGASAIYGSDAVGGVVDIKLRKDYEGVAYSATVGNYFNTDALLRKADVIVGTHNAKTSIVANLSWMEQNSTFARDFGYTASANKVADGTAYQANPHFIAKGWDKVETDTYTSEEEYIKATAIPYFGSVAGVGLFDSRSNTGYPGYVNYGSGNKTFAAPTSTPTTSAAVSGRYKYDFQEVNGLDPWVRRTSFYTSARHDFSEALYAFAELSFSRSEAIIDSASSPASLASEKSLVEGTSMYIPSYNAYNPWGVNITSGARRLVETGNRINDVTSDTPRVLVGLGGALSDMSSFADWTWEGAILYTKNTVDTLSRGSVPDYRLQQALMGLTRLNDGTLTWNPATAQANRVYFNWFGLNDDSMAKFLTVVNPNQDTLSYKQLDLKASGTVFQLPAGNLGVAIGVEHREEALESIASDLNATGNIIGGSAGTGFAGNRKITSVYAEAEIPILKGIPFVQSLEAQLAGRYEDYSDAGFARQARPKIGLKYKPFDWLTLRGSYSRCFKAPDLAYLYTANQTTFTSGQVYDPVTKTNLTQLQVNVAGNPKLSPELTDVTYFGFAIEPKGKLKGLQISVDAFRYQQKNLLTQLSDLYGYGDFLSEAAKGNALFADKVFRNASTNEVLYIRDDYANVTHGEYKGIDIDIDYLLKTKTLGSFRFGVMGTWIHHFSQDSANMSGSYLIPKWKASANVGWRKGDWSTNLTGIYYGKRVRNYDVGSWYDEGDEIYVQYTMDPRVVVNASVSYRGFHNIDLMLAVSNLLNTKPAMDPMNQDGATTGVGYFNPTFVSFSIEHKF